MPRESDPTSWRPALIGVLAITGLIVGWGVSSL
jgi:hypothetical protein